LAIETEIRNLLIAAQQELNFHRIRYHERPVVKRVRGYRVITKALTVGISTGPPAERE